MGIHVRGFDFSYNGAGNLVRSFSPTRSQQEPDSQDDQYSAYSREPSIQEFTSDYVDNVSAHEIRGQENVEQVEICEKHGPHHEVE